MRLLPKIHDLYIGRTVLLMVIGVWAVMLGLDLTLGFADEFNRVGKGNYGVLQAITYMVYTIPRRLYQLFPYAAVIGALMALGNLAASSELTALRALGLSRRRLGLSVAAAIALLTALMVISGETLGPWGERAADALRASKTSKDMIVARYSGVWAREGEFIINAQGGQEKDDGKRSWVELQDLRLFEFAPNGQLKTITHANTGVHTGDGWDLSQVTKTTFADRSIKEDKLPSMHWVSKLDATSLGADIDRPRYLSAQQLKAGMEYRERNKLKASDFEEFYWGRWFYPINILALCLAAIPFAFGTLRSGGLGKRLFIGIVFGLAFFLLQSTFVEFAKVYKLDLRVGYAVPTVVMLLFAYILFRRKSG